MLGSLATIISSYVAVLPKYPVLVYSFDPDAHSTCGWLELVAWRLRIDPPTALATAAYVDRALRSLGDDSFWAWLRVGGALRDEILRKLHADAARCNASRAPRADEYAQRPWAHVDPASINGSFDGENHRVLRSAPLAQAVNVHGAPGGYEQFHTHRALSFFIIWGTEIYQDNHSYDGSASHVGPPWSDCSRLINASSARTLQVRFCATDWLHGNHLHPTMG
eukprot:6109343-Prymnesium_polylepis.1